MYLDSFHNIFKTELRILVPNGKSIQMQNKQLFLKLNICVFIHKVTQVLDFPTFLETKDLHLVAL